MMPEPIAMIEVDNARVQTMADGSPRFIFDGMSKAIPELSKIAQAKDDGRFMLVMVYDIDELKDAGIV
jgi:hypothetical protein